MAGDSLRGPIDLQIVPPTYIAMTAMAGIDAQGDVCPSETAFMGAFADELVVQFQSVCVPFKAEPQAMDRIGVESVPW